MERPPLANIFFVTHLQGVGIVKITKGGKSGVLVDVLRTTNTVDNVAEFSIPNGHKYVGAERSDIHAASVISAADW